MILYLLLTSETDRALAGSYNSAHQRIHERLLRAGPLPFQAAPSPREAAGEPGKHTPGIPGPQARLGWLVGAQFALVA